MLFRVLGFAMGKFLRNQSTHQNNGGRSLNQNHSKRRYTNLREKPDVRKTTEKEENFTITMTITSELL